MPFERRSGSSILFSLALPNALLTPSLTDSTAVSHTRPPHPGHFLTLPRRPLQMHCSQNVQPHGSTKGARSYLSYLRSMLRRGHEKKRWTYLLPQSPHVNASTRAPTASFGVCKHTQTFFVNAPQLQLSMGIPHFGSSFKHSSE
jgi:hypothetical protein